MISEKQFLKLPKCKKCNNKTWYDFEVLTEEDQDIHGCELGEMIRIKCSTCNSQLRRREIFMKDKGLEDILKYYELDDYNLPINPPVDLKKTEEAINLIAHMTEDFKSNVIDVGGFILLCGMSNSGKSITAHIMARSAAIDGYTCRLVSVLDLHIALSNVRSGTFAKDNDNKTLFNIEDYTSVDFLILDNFEVVNEYFNRVDLRRNLLLKILRDRLRDGKPTMILTKVKIKDLFNAVNRELYQVPYDFPVVINKNYRNLSLHGRYKKEKSKPRIV